MVFGGGVPGESMSKSVSECDSRVNRGSATGDILKRRARKRTRMNAWKAKCREVIVLATLLTEANGRRSLPWASRAIKAG